MENESGWIATSNQGSNSYAALGGGWRDTDLPAVMPTMPAAMPKPSPVKKGWWPF